MQDNLVIVESPAKAKTIEKFLGDDFKVMSSYGHIRDLKRKGLSIDTSSLMPDYEIPDDKKKIVSELKKNAKAAKKVWLASDEDREGEAISWHLCEVLGLDEKSTSRIVFHEITKPAILKAIESPRHIDMNLVNAQQARRILDRIVGFKLSPVLWRKVRPSLSAGRVQSVAVRLIVEREREIQNFKCEPYYRVSATFIPQGDDSGKAEIKADLSIRYKTRQEALDFLERCKEACFKVTSIAKKPLLRTPPPPFTTSTLQQEAARKLGFSVSQTMRVAQRLYENGLITYMRTDSVNLSSLCINASRQEIVNLYGDEYSKARQYHTSSKGAQEAHEAIRPTYMSNLHIKGERQDQKLYDLIWKRTVASQMADAKVEKTTITIDIENADGSLLDTAENITFIATGEVIRFDGFMKAYHESTDEDTDKENGMNHLPTVRDGEMLKALDISSTERFSQGPARYTEASLVHKMEELGIGRPSTYAPTISTIQQREYVVRGDKKGENREYTIDTLKDNAISTKVLSEVIGSDRGKLIPTDTGIVVNDFLMENFKEIMDYNFTANIEQEFDKIAEGKEDWTKEMKRFYDKFDPEVEKVINMRNEHKTGERILGEEPGSGKPVLAKIGRFGSMIQIGAADDKEKPRFAQIPSGKSVETITLEEALELFKLPRTIGDFEGDTVTIGTGKFGPYIKHDGKYVSLPKTLDPMTVTLEESIGIIIDKREQEKKRHLKKFEQDSDLEIMNGRYGPYIEYKGKNYRLPKARHEKAAEMTYEECMEIVNSQPATKPSRRKK